MDQPKIERLLLLMKYLTGNTTFTVSDLAKRLQTTYRSIYRYIDTFKEIGFAVQKMGPGVYQLVSMNNKVPDLTKILYFTEEEAGMLNRLIDGLDESNTLKLNLRQKLTSVCENMPKTCFGNKSSNSQNISQLSQAINQERCVVLNYMSSHSGETSDRKVEPYEFTHNYSHVWAFDLTDMTNKMFKIERINDVDVSEQEWGHKAEHHAKHTDLFHMPENDKGTKVHVTLLLGMKAKNLLLEEFPLAEGAIQKSGRKWVLETDVFSMRGIGRFVIGLADDIKVVDSPELMEYIRNFTETYVPQLTKHIHRKKK